jgi:FlaA1/EpsC-like NDP-sugar epimerase
VVLVDLLLTVAGNYFAFWLRFDGVIPADYWDLWRQTIPLLVLFRGLTFIPFHLHDSLWQYVGLRDLRAIVASVTASSLLFCLLIRGVLGLHAYPRSVFVTDLVLAVFLMGATRIAWRLWREYRANTRTRRVLIFGAGDAGARIVREILKGGEHGYHPVGFVDDDPA